MGDRESGAKFVFGVHSMDYRKVIFYVVGIPLNYHMVMVWVGGSLFARPGECVGGVLGMGGSGRCGVICSTSGGGCPFL